MYLLRLNNADSRLLDGLDMFGLPDGSMYAARVPGRVLQVSGSGAQELVSGQPASFGEQALVLLAV